MERQFFSDNILVQRIKQTDEVSFLFGSALSAIKDGAGISNVSQVIDIVKDYANELDLLDDYNEFISGKDEQVIYQESFAYMSAIKGAASTKEIVKRVVMKNYDTDTAQHKVPKAIKDFVRSIKDGKIKVKNIITTNFDTLIETQFDAEEINYNSISIISDSNINQNSNDFINIIHIHGVWDKGDTMHTRNQLEAKREKIEASLSNLLAEQHVVVMAYSGWTDSFTRTLANIVNDDKAEYNLAWCFYEKEDGIIDRKFKDLFDELTPAISRDRIQFYKNVDCNVIFEKIAPLPQTKKKVTKPSDPNSTNEINYYILDANNAFQHIRENERYKAISFLNSRKSVFIEASLGYGLYGFIHSIIKTVKKETKCIKIDLSDVISKSQIDDKVKNDSGHNLASLIYTLGLNQDSVHFVIFDKIRGNADSEAITYLLKLQEIFTIHNKNIFLIYSSAIKIKQFDSIHVKLSELSLHETGIFLRKEFGSSRFTHNEISQIHDQSEGVVRKLEQIIYFLENSSAQEVLSQNDIFDDLFHSDCIPNTTLKQIDLLLNDPNKELTLNMLKILSILKNGETLSNLRRDKMGLNFSPRNTRELIQLELASTIYIDNATTIIRISPIIKDYILSHMSDEERFNIAKAYLSITIIESKDGIKLSSANRKIYDNGYNTEEDNANTLLRYNIDACKSKLSTGNLSKDLKQTQQQRLDKLLYLSRSYIYGLCNSSRFNEAISAISNLTDTIKDVNPQEIYRYYQRIAYAHRMKSNYEEANHYLNLCEDLCPDSDKKTLQDIYTERLHLLEKEDPIKAANFAREHKDKFHRNSPAYILSDVMMTITKDKGARIKALETLERKARRLNYHTTANNILFILNDEKNDVEKINLLNKVLATDTSAYNVCRATIDKNEVLVRNGKFDKISESDVSRLLNIYDYLFKQKFDYLFNQCHSILWSIAEHIKRDDLIVFIFYKGTIVWKLNSDLENEEKYNKLMGDVNVLNSRTLLENNYPL
ncbi:SIR2 family protein [Aeromonas hydrophila]|uniref:SIR2 family protein n=1 Tax=Aeromonas hydrophila TaxID=644 RepID=UPI003F79D5E7